MENYQAIKSSQEINCLLNYFGATRCLNKCHLKRKRCYCRKRCGWICHQCNQNSYYLSYIYTTSNRTSTYCIYHYQKHFKVLIHYWKGNVVTLYDPIAKTKKDVTLNKSINVYADSISVGNRIFIIGGYPASSEMQEVDFKSNTLIKRNQCSLQNMFLSLIHI